MNLLCVSLWNDPKLDFGRSGIPHHIFSDSSHSSNSLRYQLLQSEWWSCCPANLLIYLQTAGKHPIGITPIGELFMSAIYQHQNFSAEKNCDISGSLVWETLVTFWRKGSQIDDVSSRTGWLLPSLGGILTES